MKLQLFDVITDDTVRDVAAAVRTGQPLDVEINSPGGSVFAGVACHSLLAGVRDRVTCTVVGVAASIASVIALAGKRLLMADGSFLMVHDPWSVTVGNSNDHLATVAILDSVRSELARIYATATGADHDTVSAWMANETWFTAQQAVDLGFADAVVETIRLAAMADLSMFTNPPVAADNSNDDETKTMSRIQSADVKEETVFFLSPSDPDDGRKVSPGSAYVGPAILSKGMRRDSAPINPWAFLRGRISNNWVGAEREREINAAVTTGGDGASLVPEIVGAEIWMQLLGRSVIGESGATVTVLPNASIRIPTEATAPSAQWVSEAAPITGSDPVFSEASIAPHKISFLSTVSNELLIDAPQVADAWIRQSILNAMARGLNAGFLNGTGIENQPTGLLTGTPAWRTDMSAAAADWDMLIANYWALVGAGADPAAIRAILSPTTATALDLIREDADTTNDVYGGYLSASAPPAVRSIPLVAANIVPVADSKSKIVIADFAQAVAMYQFGPLRFDVDASSGFDSDVVKYRLVSRVDFAVKQASLIKRLDNVTVS